MKQKVNINADWLFFKSCVKPFNFDLNGGEKISVPHTWNAVDGQDGGGDYFRGTCTYVKRFKTPDFCNNEEVYLEFCGVSASAEIYLNDVLCFKHDGGYSTFRFPVTDKLNAKENELIVYVNNEKNDKVYPQNADFTFYGGIYRDVNLLIVPANRFDLDYYGGNGVYVTPTVNPDGTATVNVKSYVTGKGSVLITIGDKALEGNNVNFEFPTPHLWNGRTDPYLYTATANLIVDGKISDTKQIKFGIRSFSIDPNEGFILNGNSYPLRGVAKHQDWESIGNAITKEHMRKDMQLIYDMGCTTVRLAHYQHDDYIYELCDELGIVVWAEIPYISEHLDNAMDNAISQMTELIIQNYNHPSIVVWGLSNEITMANGDNPNLVPFHKKLNELCHKLDKKRLTTMACISTLPTNHPLLDVTDVLSYNHYFGWYGGKLEDNGKWFDEFHKLHPDIPVGMSEYGCENSLWHSSYPEPGDYSNEYQMIYHESMIKQLFSRKYMWATHVWNMFDFAADARDEGGTHGRNNKGLVTFDRKIKKDAYYAYQAWLTETPMLHLCSKEYKNRDGEKTEIVAYSNCKEVSLFINGKLVETKIAGDHFFHFTITQPHGEYSVEVKSGNLSESATFTKVDKADPSYSFGNATVLNWFDIETPDGYFSVKDLMRDLMTNDEAKKIAMDLVKEFTERRAKEHAEKEKIAGKALAKSGEGMSKEQRMHTTLQFSILQIIRMGAPDYPKEKIIELNKKLNKIKK